ncbi:hypothetical protein ABT063_49190 [Streptomyces sp. NPDC002838]|uniref:hypothetical protein n=1 Tax=Streptomyces sp. NPDC002838 TaxID=3154436 RepID=UPI00332585FC
MTRVVVTGGRVTVQGDAARVEATKCVVPLTRMVESSTRVNVKALSEALLAEYDELLTRHAPSTASSTTPGGTRPDGVRQRQGCDIDAPATRAELWFALQPDDRS